MQNILKNYTDFLKIEKRYSTNTVQSYCRDITGFSFHPLKVNMRGFYSVFVPRNHRTIFRFEDGKAFDIDLVDYH